MPHRLLALGSLLVAWLHPGIVTAATLPLLRFPDASADRLAFVARGNLWIAPRTGGSATALTDDPGQVFLPRFSPDGRTIAFTWRQAGSEDVWVVPSAGGAPRRLTSGPSSGDYDNMVAGWSPDGRNVLFLSQREARFRHRDVAAYAVPAGGGLATRLMPGNAGLLCMSPDGAALAYDRTFRTFGGDRWKRYVGGQVPKIFVLDLPGPGRQGLAQHALAPSPGADTAPMWWRDRIYFLSDRGPERRLNLWVTDRAGHAPRQVTHFADDDVDVPALGRDAVLFGQDGNLWRLDLPGETLHPIAVTLPPAPARVAHREVPAAAFLRTEDGAGVADAAVSPDGGTVVVASYGQLLAATAGAAPRVLTDDVDADEDKPAISPDGRTVAFVTMAAGEPEIAVRPLGGGRAAPLTHVSGAVFHAPLWSPDGHLLAVADAEHALWLVRADGSGAARIAEDRFADIRDAAFSPDGSRLAWSTTRVTGGHALHLRALATGQEWTLSSPLADDRAPAFAADGRSLLFLSARREFPVLADRDQGPDIVTTESDGLYRVALPDRIADATDAGGLTDDAVPLPASPGVLDRPQIRGGTLFYEVSQPGLIAGTLPGPQPALHALDLARGVDRVVAPGGGAAISGDGRTAVLLRDGTLARVDVASGSATPVVAAAARLAVDPAAAWRKDVDEAWHLDADLFWDPHLAGLDWKAVGRHAAALAARAGSHEDAVYVLGDMQAELSTSHFFIDRGDTGDTGDDRAAIGTALLGVDFAPDPARGHIRLARIFRGDPSRPRFRAPLGGASGVAAGDLLLAIDGAPVGPDDDPYALLRGRTGAVTLTVAAGPGAPVRSVTVQPVASETALRQLGWIRDNRARVAALSGGRVGYVFVSDFFETGTEDFDRQYYAQTDRQGLVIDDRWNSGGFTSQWVINVLGRRRGGFFRDREGGVTPLPGSLAPPGRAVVTNIFSASDGDQFPFFMRRFGLATVVGERTWGGVSGIAQPWTLLDGTTITIPKDRLFAPDGRAIIENHGADPDILVHDAPGELVRGRDAQLEEAVRQALAQRVRIQDARAHGHPADPVP